jgi:hypothetical protein
MRSTTDAQIQVMLDREEIVDCLHRYARGVDRLDRELILSAYHPDAIDSHGAFSGTPVEFVEWILPRQMTRKVSQHYITNHTIDIEGDVAHVETYFTATLVPKDGERVVFRGGRYIDRLERRNGEWRIAVRNVVGEWATLLDGAEREERFPVGARDSTDMSYDRPLLAVGSTDTAPA